MNKLKVILDEISILENLKDRKITKFIKRFETEDYGSTENTKFLSNKINELINEYEKNGKNRES